MDLFNGYVIALLVVLAYVAIVVGLWRAGKLGPDRPLSLFGPALMIKTRRGRGWLERMGRFRRLWSRVGDIGILLAAVAMVSIVVLLIIDAIVALRLSPSQALSPQEALGIPGINPIIPIGYGILALIVGVVLHELMHGILARSQDIGVKSLGILWFVVPVGAFVEQDDEEMAKATRRRRDRVAAAGVLANLLLAAVFAIGAAALVTTSVEPNANGVGLAYVVPNTPAANASLEAGGIITAINGTPVTTDSELFNLLSVTRAGETVNLTYVAPSGTTSITKPVTLTALSSLTGKPSDRLKGFLGVSPTFLTPAELKTTLVTPWASSNGPLIGATDWLVLPLATLEPVQGVTIQFYHLSGAASSLSTGGFWVTVNALYWLAWMNLLLGVSNALPLVPLDGGLLFRDFAASAAARLRKGWDEKKLDVFAGRAVATSSVIVILLLLWQFVVPRL